MIDYIDLFSGLGGFSLGLKKFKWFNCVFASEIEPEVRDLYRNNFSHNLKGDITKIKAGDIPKHDVLCASPPCQSFSIAGKRLGFNDPRGLLFLEIFRVAEYHKPKIIFVENVPHILKVQQGEALKKIKLGFEKLGYRLYIHNLFASDYGIPQTRRRVYFVGIRKDLNLVSYEPTKSKKIKCVQDYMYPDADIEDVFFRNRYLKYVNKSLLRKTFNKRKSLLLGNYARTNEQSGRIFSTLSVAPTQIKTNANRGLYYTKYENIRKLTTKEIKKIMGFDKFILPDDVKYKKYLGNAIIPKMVEIVFSNIR